MSFTVLMSLYSGSSCSEVVECFQSLLVQTDLHYDVQIVIDGPVSLEQSDLVDEFKQVFNSAGVAFSILKLPANLGLGLALKAGLHLIKTKYVIRMDADDICRPGRVAAIKEYVQKNPYYAVYGWLQEEFERFPGDLSRIRHVPATQKEILRFAKLRNPMNHVTVCFEAEAVRVAGSYEHMPFYEDYWLWVKMLNLGMEFVNVPLVLTDVRAGVTMAQRRSGFKYFSYDIQFAFFSWRSGFFSFFDFLAFSISRFPFRFLSPRALNWFYKRFLRTVQ